MASRSELGSDSEREILDLLAEEYLELLQRGERPQLDDFISRCPGRADEIRAMVTAIEHLQPITAGIPTLSEPTPPPRELGRYRIVRELGRGGMGVVYEAEEIGLGRRVALKVLPQHATSSSQFLERFRREAQAAACLQHPHIVMVHGVGEDDGRHFYAMQHVDGDGLDRLIERCRESDPNDAALAALFVDVDQKRRLVARIGLQVAEALQHAHEHGILHRDLKPSNILLDKDGEAWLSDFGLCKVAEAGDLTQSGDLVGTLRYMAPERLSGRTDERSDIYSLGATLYEMLAGEPAFSATDRVSLLHEVQGQRVKKLSEVDPGIARDLETIVHRSLAPDPGLRYASASELAQDLRAFLDERPITARQPTLPYLLWLAIKRNRVLSTTIAAAVLIVATMTLFYVTDLERALRERDESLVQTRALALASAAGEAIDFDPMLGLLLAKEAVRLEQSSTTLSQLHRSLGAVHERAVLDDHKEAVQRVFAGAGDWFVSSDGYELRSWRRGGEPLATFSLAAAQAARYAVAPTAQRVALLTSTGERDELTLWDPVTDDRRVLPTVQGAHAVSFSHDESAIAVASTTELATIDVGSGSKTRVGIPASPVTDLLFAPDDTGILIATFDVQEGAVVQEIERATGAVRWRHALGAADITPVYAPNGSLIAVRHGTEASVWDRNGKKLATLSGHRDRITTLDVSPDGSLLLTGSTDQTARLWRPDGSLVATLHGHGGGVNVARFVGEGGLILTGSADQSAMIWDSYGAAVIRLRGHGASVFDAVLTDDGATVITASKDTTLRLWDLQSPSLPVLRGHEQGLYTAAFDATGERIVTSARDRTARVFDRFGRQLASIPHALHVYSARFLPDGEHIFTTTAASVAHIWNLDGEEVGRVVSPEQRILCGRFDVPVEGGLFVARGHDRDALLLRRDGTVVANLVGHEQLVWGADVSADGSRIVTCGFDRTARVWDVDGRSLAVLRGHDGASVNAAAFSPDATSILTACDDGTARLWTLTGECRTVFRGHEGAVLGAVFSPDGRQVLTASRDQTARIWQLDGSVVAVLTGHEGVVWSAEFSSDGRRIVTSSFDHTARCWLARPKELLEAADARSFRDFTTSERQRYEALLEGPR